MKRFVPIATAALFAAFMMQTTSVEAKFYGGKECRNDYKRLCGNTPRGKCDLATMTDKLSPACKAVVKAGQ
jgi:hypothetical protein